MEKIILRKTIEFEFTPEQINDFIVGALEGGINYWCRKARIKMTEDDKYFGVAEEDQDNINYASDAIGYGGTLILFDAESDDRWELDLPKMLKGIELYCKDRMLTYEFIVDDYDAGDCDGIVQFALFGEIQFG